MNFATKTFEKIAILSINVVFLRIFFNNIIFFVNILKDRQIIITSDGSKSIYIPKWEETYHSRHGAITEAYHVFIEMGLKKCIQKELKIAEIGLGTGLNCLITFLENKQLNKKISYTAYEAFPITEVEANKLNYMEVLQAEKYQSIYERIHQSDWGKPVSLDENFSLLKKKEKFQDINDQSCFHLIYFDAFAPRVQPELWTLEIMQKMYKALVPNGIFVTYSAKGSVRRNLQEAGFEVKKLPGPPGKREMLFARKK